MFSGVPGVSQYQVPGIFCCCSEPSPWRFLSVSKMWGFIYFNIPIMVVAPLVLRGHETLALNT